MALVWGYYLGEWVKLDTQTNEVFFEDGYREKLSVYPKLEDTWNYKKRNQWGSPTYLEALKMIGCLVPRCWTKPIDAAHVTSRGAGGTWEDLVPLCWKHHREQHYKGIQYFQSTYNLNLPAYANQISEALGFLVKV